MRKLQVTRRLVIVFILFAAIVAAGAYGWSVKNNKDNDVSYSGLCSSDEIGAEIKASYSGVSVEHSTKMQDVVNRITQLPNHRKSVNCLFVLAKYNSYTGQYSAAAEYYDELLRVHEKTGEWIDRGIGIAEPEDIAASSKFMKEGGGIKPMRRVTPEQESQ